MRLLWSKPRDTDEHWVFAPKAELIAHLSAVLGTSRARLLEGARVAPIVDPPHALSVDAAMLNDKLRHMIRERDRPRRKVSKDAVHP